MIKTCKHCRQELPLTAFDKDRSRPSGYKNTCTACRKAGVNKRRAKVEGMKYCPKCEQFKSALDDSFPKYPDGRLYGYCRECYQGWKRAWWAGLPIEERRKRFFKAPEYASAIKKKHWQKLKQNPERLLHHRALSMDAWRRAYAKDPLKFILKGQAERAQRAQAPGEFTKADLAACFRRQNGKCLYCDCSIGSKSDVKWSVEHLIPLSRGGSNSVENIAVACFSCNSAKRDKMPWEFMPERFPRPEVQAAD